MTALLEELPPVLRSFLQDRCEELNRRFFRVARRYPKLDSDLVLLTLADVLPALCSDGSESQTQLQPQAQIDRFLSSVYDLILLHVARDALVRHPGLSVLLKETLRDPAVRNHALRAPDRLPAELSNAIENLDKQGVTFARALGSLARLADSTEALRTAGAVLAWRLGEPRLRKVALAALESLGAALWLAALGETTNTLSAEAIRSSLSEEGWRAPSMQPKSSATEYEIVARLGEFSGFGGQFDKPPELVVTDLDDVADRHHFHVRVEEAIFRVEADRFGASIRPAHLASLGTIRPALVPTKTRSTKLAFCLTTQGALVHNGHESTIPELQGATSYLGRDRLVVVTLQDSHHIRVLAPKLAPLA